VTEHVRDFPLPPHVEPAGRRIRVVLGGETIVETTAAHRVLERNLPPVYYVPLEHVRADALEPSGGRTTVCEWKGTASYYDVVAGGERAERAAWTYPEPNPGLEPIRDAVAFYPAAMEACYVDDEQVAAQADSYYGGWITSEIEL
jgi:uncharacterized protein (DUF427 family)